MEHAVAVEKQDCGMWYFHAWIPVGIHKASMHTITLEI